MTTECLTYRATVLLFVCLPAALLPTSACQSQSPDAVQVKVATNWKGSRLAELKHQLSAKPDTGLNHDELAAQIAWLENWTPGKLTSRSRSNSQVPAIRKEPIIDASGIAGRLRKKLMPVNAEQDESALPNLERVLLTYPDDVGLRQLQLHWIDFPSRRKAHLKQVESQAAQLVELLRAIEPQTPAIRLAIEHTLYRRGRSLAYRELPLVTAQTPIDDPDQLNREIISAYNELVAESGKGRPEFILLEIRMLRRSGKFGGALGLLEQFGSTIKPQWYLKKRRDLLKELKWDVPHAEAASLYAAEFPDEVAKETIGVNENTLKLQK